MQIFQCLECTRKFTANFGFEKTKVDQSVITGAMQMYYTGMSVRDISHMPTIMRYGNNNIPFCWQFTSG